MRAKAVCGQKTLAVAVVIRLRRDKFICDTFFQSASDPDHHTICE
ncbi:hypothetical protein RD1_1736 [Roseobacter denitrificans OCh 114]|uniref:Uncharacterized protein n=1 Tax=Roseobacter denitrificans (strain ATCC 33942 / OCh 114) TaxID=375451 RepID=Q169I5_ROSDO|nr:hypothetical protein RD1_1736 [Roseobacter denitrificans OCh 114]